jgi:shikimate kinase/3-dehydroquinate synthase
VARLLRGHGLPVRCEGVDREAVLAFVERDKKRRGGRVPFVLVDAPGRVTTGNEPPPGELRAAVEEACAP